MAISFPVRSSTAASAANTNRAGCPTSSIIGTAAGSLKLALCAVYRNSTASGNLVDSYDFDVGGTVVNIGTPAARIGYTSPAGHRTEVTAWVQPNAPGGNTTGKPFLTNNDSTNNVWHSMHEGSGFVTSSPVDTTGSPRTASVGPNNANLDLTSLATHAQAEELAIVFYGSRWNYQWGDTFGVDKPPTLIPSGSSGFTNLIADASGSVIRVYAGYKILASTATLSLRQLQANQADEGSVFFLLLLKAAAGSLRVEIVGFDPAVVASVTGNDVGVWVGDPFETLRDGVYRNKTFEPSGANGGKLFLAPAPAVCVADQFVNCIIDNPTGTVRGARGIVQGQVKAYTP
jgi:hypothetical protein